MVKNAIKFTQRGFVKIIANYDDDTEMLEVHVIDNGKGIKPEEMSSLFRKFGKLRRTATLNNEGIGLGLMICQKLVTLNNGIISVRSDGENLGSVFSFTMKMM